MVVTEDRVEGAKPSALDRLLGIFTEVRAGEGLTALALAVNIFVILAAYYLIKPVREALILAQPGGAELKSYASAGQAVLLIGAVPLYGALAARLPRMRLIDIVTVFFALCLVGFFLLASSGAQVGFVFFLWVGIFNLMVPAQFWSFANDIYTPETGKRLFVLVAFGASAGAVVGSFVADGLIDRVGVYPMLLVAAVLIVATLGITHWVNARMSGSRRETTEDAPPPVEKANGFALVFANRYLLLFAVMLLLNNWVNTNGEYLLGRIVSGTAQQPGVDAEAFIGGFYARYFAIVNLVGLLLQLFVVSRIIKYIGVPIAVCILPLLALGSYATIALLPVLGVVRWFKTAENSTDYSLQNTVKQVLWLPTSREEKYAAKQAIDTFFVRAGDVCSALLVFVGTQFLGLGVRGFALATAFLALLWIGFAIRVGRGFGRLAPASETEA